MPDQKAIGRTAAIARGIVLFSSLIAVAGSIAIAVQSSKADRGRRATPIIQPGISADVIQAPRSTVLASITFGRARRGIIVPTSWPSGAKATIIRIADSGQANGSRVSTASQSLLWQAAPPVPLEWLSP